MATAILLAAVLGMYGYFLIPPYYPKIFGSYDYIRYFGPQAYFMDRTIHNGEFPLWNPLGFCGLPFAASPQQTAFYPPHLLRSLLTFRPTPFRTHVGLALAMVFHMVLAGVGTFALAREYRLSRGAGIVAALAFVFGPHFVRRVLEQWALAAVASWFPLLLFLVHRAFNATGWRTRCYYASGAGLVFGFSVLAGFPQLTFYTIIAMGLFWILSRMFERRKKGQVFIRVLGMDSVVFAILFVLGAAVAMAMLLPASDFIGASARVKGNGLEVVAVPQDLSLKYLVQSMIVYEGAGVSEQGCRAAGIGVLLLAIVSAFHRRRRDVAVYAILFLILCDCTLGPPFPFGRVVKLLDIFQFSSPWRAGILAGFPLAMLAGFGVDAATRILRSRRVALLRSVLVFVAGAAALYVVLLWIRHDLPMLQQRRIYGEVTPFVLLFPGLSMLAIALAGWLPYPRCWRTVLPLLVFAEMYCWNLSYFPAFIARSGYKDKPAVLAGAEQIPCINERGADPRPNTGFYTLQPSMNGYDPVCFSKVRQLLCAPNREKHYLRTLKDWEVTADNQRGLLFLKRPFWLARQYAKGALPSKEALFPPTTTVFLNETPSLPIPEAAAAAVPPHSVSENVERTVVADADFLAKQKDASRCTLPPFSTKKRHAALSIRYATQDAATVSITFRETASGRSTAGMHHDIRARSAGELEFPLPDYSRIQATLTWKGGSTLQWQEACVLCDRDDENDAITLASWRANSVELTLTNLPGNRILLFTDAMFEGWHAYIDGVSCPILTGDDVFKAVAVPAGTHHIRFAFTSWRVTAGSLISVVSVGGIVLFLCMGRRKRLFRAQRCARDVP